MSITDMHAKAKAEGKTIVSFEIFPPKGDLPLDAAVKIASNLAQLKPSFISVTYSAAGSGNNETTAEVASIVQDEFDVPVMAHLTCMGATRASIDERIADYCARGIENVLALCGDPLPGAPKSDFQYAKDLIPLLKASGLTVGAAAYPEGHVSCFDLNKDCQYMLEKQNAGADFFVTQLFFDNECFYRFVDRADRAGITKPIHAGIMPFLSKSQIERMVFTCGASLPASIIKVLAKHEDDPDALLQAGVEYAAQQAIDLVKHGVDGIHLYTMNRPHVTRQIVKLLRDACPSCL